MNVVTCDLPACSQEASQPADRWLVLHEVNGDGPWHFCSLEHLGDWIQTTR